MLSNEMKSQILLNLRESGDREFVKLPDGTFFICGKSDNQGIIKILKEIIKDLKEVEE